MYLRMCWDGVVGNLDHFYIDGQEVSYYSSEFVLRLPDVRATICSVRAVSGVCQLGVQRNILSLRCVADAADCGADLCVSQIRFATEVASRGVAVTPATTLVAASAASLLSGIRLLWAGTSLTSQAWPANLSLTNQPAYNVGELGNSRRYAAGDCRFGAEPRCDDVQDSRASPVDLYSAGGR